MLDARGLLLSALLSGRLLSPSGTVTAPDPAEALQRANAAAEASLRETEFQAAESHLRSALLEGWLLLGSLEAAEGRLPAAREAFRRAASAAVENRRALQSLARLDLELNEPREALQIATPLVGRDPRDFTSRRILVEALIATGRLEEALEQLEEARTVAPGDLELSFMLASGHLRLKQVEAAERLFAEVLKGRPIPQTHVLIGRTYREFGEFARARAELRSALRQDPRVRRAHNNLGMVDVLEDGVAGLDRAIAEFQEERKLAPEDPATNLRLGMALVEAQRPAEALPALELAARAPRPEAEALQYLGRCQLALSHPAQAAPALSLALDLARSQGARDSQLGSIHYQLGLALRGLGAEGSAAHFAEAERLSSERAHEERATLVRYLAGEKVQAAPVPEALGAEPLAELSRARRTELRNLASSSVARAYLNLGVMQLQREHFARAAGFLGQAAEVDPELPQVQYSLGVARFNAKQYAQAVDPLGRALAATPGDLQLRRMLALAWLNTEAYDKASSLLREDPGREADPSLQYAYGVALVRSDHAQEAQSIFSELLARHGDSAELNVVLGEAHAQQGDYDRAIQALTRALALKPGVAEANAALGVIFLKQGRLPEAEGALRAELERHPGDLKSLENLATVLDLEGRPEEALPLVRSALKQQPELAHARYLLGKILLGQGAAAEAVEHLAAAARQSPEDANVHYQLGRAYQRLGKADLAEQQFEIFQTLKGKLRGNSP